VKTRAGWGAVALVGVVTFGACVDQAEDEGQGRAERSSGARTAVVELLTTSREAESALSSEGAATGVGILGLEDAMTSPALDEEEARRQTDESVTALEAAVEAHEDEGGAYRTALGALGGLESLRAEVDDRTEPPGLDQAAAAEAIYQRYSEVTAPLLDANERLALSIDDPDVRVGAELYATGLELSALGPRLVSTLVITTVAGDGAGLTTPDGVSGVAALHEELVRRRASVTETAVGTDYEAAAQALELQLDESGFIEVTQRALETGTVDLSGLMQSSMVVERQGWPVFLDEVEDILAG
jgi:Nitrate and nitrite sensing